MINRLTLLEWLGTSIAEGNMFRNFAFGIFITIISSSLGANPSRLILLPGENSFIGTVGNYPIHMSLQSVSDSAYTGTYSYTRHPASKIALQSVSNDFGSFSLQESIPKGYSANKVTGVFEVKLEEFDTFSGVWHSADGRKSLPFKLQANALEPPSGQYVCAEGFGWLRIVSRGGWVAFLLESSRGAPSYSSCGESGRMKLDAGKAVFASEEDGVKGGFTFQFTGMPNPIECNVKVDPFDPAYCGANTVFCEGHYLNVAMSAGKKRNAEIDRQLKGEE